MLSSLTKPIPPLPIPHSMVPKYIYIYMFSSKSHGFWRLLILYLRMGVWLSRPLGGISHKLLIPTGPRGHNIFRPWRSMANQPRPRLDSMTQLVGSHATPWRISKGRIWPDSKWNYDFIPGLENAINIWVCNNLKCSKSLACFLRQTNAMKFHHLLREMVIKLLRFTASGRNHPAHPVIADRNGKFRCHLMMLLSDLSLTSTMSDPLRWANSCLLRDLWDKADCKCSAEVRRKLGVSLLFWSVALHIPVVQKNKSISGYPPEKMTVSFCCAQKNAMATNSGDSTWLSENHHLQQVNYRKKGNHLPYPLVN